MDAFDLAWSRGLDVKLCIIGKVGWKTEALIQRIRNHPEYGRRLLMLNQASDAELEYAYQHSRALVFASFVEVLACQSWKPFTAICLSSSATSPSSERSLENMECVFNLEQPASLTEDLVRLGLILACCPSRRLKDSGGSVGKPQPISFLSDFSRDSPVRPRRHIRIRPSLLRDSTCPQHPHARWTANRYRTLCL